MGSLVRSAIALALGGTFCLALARSPGQEEVQIQVQPVAGNVHMLVGRGGNIGLCAGDDGILMIDDQFAELAPSIQEALKTLSPNPLEFVLNTHFHGDHTGGNAIFGREAHIVAHANVRERLSTAQTVRGRETPPQPKEALPVVTFEDELTFHFNGETIRVLHLANGHTDGDSVIFFANANTVHMGDLFFAGRFPFIDLEHGGDPVSLARNVARVLEMVDENVRIIPGHGPLSSKQDLARYHKMLEDSISRVRAALAEGKTPADMLAANLLSEYTDWGSGFINTESFLGTLVAALSS
jgi:glyoxylase-like metal-dependent hydrolase (beta-lactamase superfamily II)